VSSLTLSSLQFPTNNFTGFFYGGYGAIITPLFGVSASYGTETAEFNNALGYWVLMWTVLNLFFLIASLPVYASPSLSLLTLTQHRNLVYIGIFLFVELSFALISGSYFAAADGKASLALALKKTGGVFAFLAGLLGYYTVAHLMCQTALFWHFPMGDTSKYFVRRSERADKGG
jgi:hypothetical protein